MYEKKFAERLAELRIKKGVSARDMSLSLGQSESYINMIENGRNFPAMQAFFYICEYLAVEPKEFFDFTIDNPAKISEVVENLKRLNEQELDQIAALAKTLADKE